MTRDRKEQLLQAIEVEVEKIKKASQETKEAADQRMVGWSQAGDKYHAQSSASLTKAYLESLKKLEKEIRDSSDKVMEKVVGPCFVEIKYDGAPNLSFFLVKNAASVPNVLLISADSPLGCSIKGKKVGDKFSYKLDKKDRSSFSGKILRVE